ncbi:MAG: hypothetical protein AB7O24_08970 [Kofleriaceae bacterium]
MFLELGEPTTWVSKRTATRTIQGARVACRPAGVSGSHSIRLEMAAWQVFSGQALLADSEATGDVIRTVLHWLEGQHLMKLAHESPTSLSLHFDLQARFELTSLPDIDGDSALFSIKHGDVVTSLRADGNVAVEPWSHAE